MSHRIKVTAVVVIILLTLSLGLNIVLAVNNNAEPGSAQDPIVSKSYVDAEIAKLLAKIESLVNQNTQLTTRLATSEKTIKTLQQELKAIKPDANVGTGGTTDTGSTPTKPATPATIGKGVVNVAVLNLRSQPTTNSSILGKLLKNETLTLVSKTGDWYKVTTSRGTTGYIMGTYVTVQK